MHPPLATNKQRGMTLVELMIGLAIGLFIVATALGLAVNQLKDDRALLQESRLLINLQTAADVVIHDLRRAGYRGDAGSGIARAGSAAVANVYDGVTWAVSDDTLLLTYSQDDAENNVVNSNEHFGYRLNAGVIEMLMGGSGFQAVTDVNALVVTAFTVTPVVQDVPLGSFCEQPCPVTQAGCPHQQIRRYDLVIAARSASDATVARELRTSVRVRNDVVSGACPA